ncbi:uncharacterized protein PGTG_17573 [Puccinia graminis f. sp. tritici CRL 75-36-700-3]|uniref:C2H2-type domain-containing protein n=1 Tax=Puccinia graminis f. sp. tritici (strain CRL 75-36-700-3 / race SCCL) TaxID=418459 RepID=E3L4P4_PUCGT|nr:uncharacterized protein PGTG_17573 [Puccinia graminis f. sp. tritici CRL 75-36-700-3]EFP91519.2 hypothetical protein PGTG_17573 [Puccinia graminis f. sp. tritici CRL 75-36-700-3]
MRELANLLGLAPEAQQAPLASTSAHQLPPTILISQPQSSPGPQPFQVAQQYYHYNSTQSAPLPVAGPSNSLSQPAQWQSTLTPMLQHFTASNETFVQPGQQDNCNPTESASAAAGPSNNFIRPEPVQWESTLIPILAHFSEHETQGRSGQRRLNTTWNESAFPTAGPSSLSPANNQLAPGFTPARETDEMNIETTRQGSQSHQKNPALTQEETRVETMMRCPFGDCTYTVTLKRFSNLKAHMMAHQDPKPIECQVCQLRHAYYRPNELKEHVESLTDPKSGQPLRLRFDKKLHMRQKSDEELSHELRTFGFMCALCESMHTSAAEVEAHLGFHHGRSQQTEVLIHQRTPDEMERAVNKFEHLLGLTTWLVEECKRLKKQDGNR